MRRGAVVTAMLIAALAWWWRPPGGEYLMVVVWETHSDGWKTGQERVDGAVFSADERRLEPGSLGGRWLRNAAGVVLFRVDYLDETREERLFALGRRPVKLTPGADAGVVSALPGPSVLVLGGLDEVHVESAGSEVTLGPGEWWSVAIALTAHGTGIAEPGDDPGSTIDKWREAGYPVTVARIHNLGLWPRAAIGPARGGAGGWHGDCW